MRYRSFEAGTVVCREGEPGESMFLIVDGLVQARVSALEARALSMFAEDRLAGKLRQGDAIGATSLITGEPRSATIIASVPTNMLELDSEAFRALIARFPRLLREPRRASSAAALGEASSRQAAARAARRRAARRATRTRSSRRPAASSVKPVTALARRDVDALAQLDQLLGDHGTVILDRRARLGGDEPLLLEHVDRAVALGDERDAARAADPSASTASLGPRDRDVAWLGRHLARTKLGLALGAGGAKGFAHVGALLRARGRGLHGRLRRRLEHRRDRRRVHRLGPRRARRPRPRCATAFTPENTPRCSR